MKRKLLTTLLTAAVSLTAANAAIVINLGNNTAAGMNNYAPPGTGLQDAAAGNFTTSISGATGGTGTNYNTVQVFTDTASNNTGLTLDIHRTGGRVNPYAVSPVFNNTIAVSEMSTTTGVSTTNLDSSLTTFIASAAGGSLINTVSLNNLGMAGGLVTLYFGVSTSAQDNTGVLTSVLVTGGTGTLSFAGQGGTGFDQATLAGSGPGTAEMTLVKWVGTVGAGDSLTVGLDADGGKKAGIGFVAVVPEPSSTALLGLGGLALILRRRRK